MKSNWLDYWSIERLISCGDDKKTHFSLPILWFHSRNNHWQKNLQNPTIFPMSLRNILVDISQPNHATDTNFTILEYSKFGQKNVVQFLKIKPQTKKL